MAEQPGLAGADLVERWLAHRASLDRVSLPDPPPGATPPAPVWSARATQVDAMAVSRRVVGLVAGL